MEVKSKSHCTATLGGGCFWCIEAVYLMLRGVGQVISGYSGGHVPNPTYREVCYGKTGHAEVVQIHYDENIISFEELLEIFWTAHDPTTPNRQGNDIGPQYRSIILYHDESQRKKALDSIKNVASSIWDDPIVTEVLPYQSFYPAEAYHQDFYRLNPGYGYCRVVIDPKIAKVRAKFLEKLKKVKQ